MSASLMVDQASIQLDEALTDEVLAEGEKFCLRELLPILDRTLDKSPCEPGPLEPQQAGLLISEAISVCTEKLKRYAEGYTSLRWLYMLRRLPVRTFSGRLGTTFVYDSALAEAISGGVVGKSRLRVRENEKRHYPLDQTIVKRLSRYCSGIRFLSTLHTAFRWSSKDSLIEVERGRRWRWKPKAELRESVSLHDERVDASAWFGRLGTPLKLPLTSDIESSLISLTSIEPIRIEVPRPDSPVDEHRMVLVDARFFPNLISLDQLGTLVTRCRPAGHLIIDKQAAALLYLLFCLPIFAAAHRAGLYSLATVGYLLVGEERLETWLAGGWSLAPTPLRLILEDAGLLSARDVISTLDAVQPTPWPLASGPVFHRDLGSLAVDIAAASRRLSTALEFPELVGPVANARATHFELSVQAAVDESKWCPPENLRKLRGKTLKLDGDAITDIDALGSVGTTLLLVSCKSLVFRPEHDAGIHRVVRNSRETVEQAWDRWAKVISRFEQERIGDNYDFSAFDRIVGVVCTPHVVFVNIGACTDLVLPGLRAVSAFVELQAWLEQPDDPTQ